MKRQKVFVCAAVIAIVVLLGALALALYALGKCPRHCEFPEFCEELSFPIIKGDAADAQIAPVSLKREVFCAQGRERVTIHAKLSRHPEGGVDLDFEMMGFDGIEDWNWRVANPAASEWLGYLRHNSRSTLCGRHDCLGYIILDREKSNADKLVVKVGIGYPSEFFGQGYIDVHGHGSLGHHVVVNGDDWECSGSLVPFHVYIDYPFWHKVWYNLRSAF